MIKIDELEYLVKTCLYSAYLEGEKPLSLLITASVESGKTEIVKKFWENKGILYISNLTAWGLQHYYIKKLASGEIKHIIIPDLLAPLSRNADTVASLVAFFNSLTEEGIKEVATYTMAFSLPKPVICGLITTITKDDLFIRKQKWTGIGFLSRMLPVSYSYASPTVSDILESIAKQEYFLNKEVKLNFPKSPIKITLPQDIAERTIHLSTHLVSAENLYGFRMQKHLQRLLMSHALMKGRITVNQDDFEAIKEMTRFINLDFNAI